MMITKRYLALYSIWFYIIAGMVSGNSGATLVRVSRIVVVVCVLFSLIEGGKLILPQKGKNYLVWHCLFLLYCALGVYFAYSRAWAVSGFTTLMYVVIVDFLIYMYLCVEDDIMIVESLVWACIVGALLKATNIYVSNGFFAFMDSRRAENVSANTVGLYCAFASIFLIYKLIKIKEMTTHKLLCYVLLLMSLLFMVLSASRKSFIYLLIPLVFYGIFSSKNILRLFKNALLCAALVVLVYILLTRVPFLYNLVGIRMETMINGIFDTGGTVDSSSATRLRLIERGMSWFRENPLWGYGLSNFKVLNGEYTGTTTSDAYYAHNNYVELLVDCGIVGTIIYYSLHFRLLLRGLKDSVIKTQNRILIIFTGCILAIVVCDYGIVSYYDIFLNLILLLSSYILFSYSDNDFDGVNLDNE